MFLFDRGTKSLLRVSDLPKAAEPNNASYGSSVSGGGRFVAFISDASNLVRRDTNAERDVYVRDRSLDASRLVSLTRGGKNTAGGADTPSLSASGAWVVFEADGAYAGPDALGFYDIFERGPLI